MKPLSILIITGDSEIIAFLKPTCAILQPCESKQHFQCVTSSLQEALEILHQTVFTIIITSLHLKDSEGINTFFEIHRVATSTPIIIVDEEIDNETMHAAAIEGAQDCLSKSDLNPSLLAHSIQLAIDRQQLHEHLKALTFTDALTGIYNRRGFLTLLDQQMALARRIKKGFYLFVIDFDELKQINDTYGHLIGDKALIETAHCLKDSVRQQDVIGRMGGDEFAIIAIHASLDHGDHIKERILDKLNEYNTLRKEPFCFSFSVGKAFFDGGHEVTQDELFQAADLDLYYQKRLSHDHKTT